MWTLSPWFMALTSQVSMQYCSLQRLTLLPSPVTSTTGCCFSFDSVSSFFLELFLYWSLVAYWAPTDLGSSSFSVLLSLCLIMLFMGVLKARILKWFAIPFSSGPRFVNLDKSPLICLELETKTRCVCVCLLSHFSRFRLFVTLWAVARQVPLSVAFSRQEYWGGLPCPPPGDLPDPGMDPRLLWLLHWQVDSLPLAPSGNSYLTCIHT